MKLCASANSVIQHKYSSLSPILNERQRRIWAGNEALALGWGGISIVSQSTGLSRTTVSKGTKEVQLDENLTPNSIRKKGGGRKRKEIHDPSLRQDILTLVAPDTRGDPQSLLRWKSKSLRKIVKALKKMKNPHNVSVFVVRRILHDEGYSLQSNRKVKEGGDHPDRDEQFQNIAKTQQIFMNEGEPVISIDGKKKELIGDYKNGGLEWTLKYCPTEVNVYDFPKKGGYKATPYGIYDVRNNHGFLNVGVSAETSAFAGRSIAQWWMEEGSKAYPNAKKLLILSDGGGSNGSRRRLWKVVLQDLANLMHFPITVRHYPPRTSKWNKIEHRLFGPISINWRGKPLDSLETICNLISNTTTTTGLTTTCRLDLNNYKKGIKISDKQMKELKIVREMFHGEWNYTIYPKLE